MGAQLKMYSGPFGREGIPESVSSSRGPPAFELSCGYYLIEFFWGGQLLNSVSLNLTLAPSDLTKVFKHREAITLKTYHDRSIQLQFIEV